jgi:sugar-specific transcriptional regulator TrmB
LQPEHALAAFGFTELESRVYFELLSQSPLTGYRLSQLVGKAPTNIYQALKSMAQKGAVVASETQGDATAYSPVPPIELMTSIGRSFEARRSHALDVLKQVYTRPSGERVFQLRTAAQVFEHARSMLERAQKIVLFDLFPELYSALEPDIDAARRRGVRVIGITYDEGFVGPHTVFNDESAPYLAELWPGLGLILVADGEQELIAQLSRDMTGLLNGIWSDSPFLSCAYHSALAAEIRSIVIRQEACDRLKEISLVASQPLGLSARALAAPAIDA